MAPRPKKGVDLAIVFGKGGPPSKGPPPAEPEDEETPPEEETESTVPADVAGALDDAGIDSGKQASLYEAIRLICQREMG